MTSAVLRFGDLPISRWQNGAGRKADIASSPDWHIGFAWLDQDAAFSDFTGHDRTITLVEGAGFTLQFPGRPALRVDTRYHPASFDGGWPTGCSLVGGPSLVLNAMTARARYRHQVITHDAVSPGRIEPSEAEAVFLVVLAGRAVIGDDMELGPRDAIRVGKPLPFHLPAGGHACTVRIERHGGAP